MYLEVDCTVYSVCHCAALHVYSSLGFDMLLLPLVLLCRLVKRFPMVVRQRRLRIMKSSRCSILG